MNAASFSTRRINSASLWMLSTLSTLGGIALPPTPMRVQSIRSPASRKLSRPTTTPFSEATTCRLERVQPSMQAMSSRIESDCTFSIRAKVEPGKHGITSQSEREASLQAGETCWSTQGPLPCLLHFPALAHLRLVLKQLDVGVEQITLGHVDLLGAQLVHLRERESLYISWALQQVPTVVRSLSFGLSILPPSTSPSMRVVMAVLRHVCVLEKGRLLIESLSTMRSSSATYI